MRDINLPEQFTLARLTHGIFSDFHEDPAGWTESGGTSALIDGAGGIFTLVTGTTANNEAFLHSEAEGFKAVNNKPIVFEARSAFTDASGATGALAIGLSSLAGAAIIANGGLAVSTSSGSSFLFVKLTGESNWRCFSRIASGTAESTLLSASVSDNLSKIAQSPSASYQRLRIEIWPNATDCLVTYKIDDVIVCQHKVDLASAEEMHVLAGFVKTTTTDAQTLNTDYAGAFQTR